MTKFPPRRRGPIIWDPATEKPLLADPEETKPFNPLDTKNLAIAITKALLERDARALVGLSTFRGAGIYAIYYLGNYQSYRLIAEANVKRQHPRWPIYVGRAIPPGGRRGAFGFEATDTPALFSRLREHADSIAAVDNLDLDDFVCRFLVVQDLWIPLGEQLLIAHFAPVWNRLVDGFGNHDPGAGRYQGMCPRWDILHPGRTWATRLRPRPETANDIQREVQEYLAGAATPYVETTDED